MSCSVCGLSKSSTDVLSKKAPFKVHRFPTEQDRAVKWAEKFPKVKFTQKSLVCSQHFLNVDYEGNIYCGKLKKDAVPRTPREMESQVVKQDPGETLDPQMLKIAENLELYDASICRVCLSSEKSAVIPLKVNTRGNRTVAEMINYVAGIELILDENLPQQVCPECMVTLSSACKIKKLCLDSEAIFRWRYENILKEDLYYEELHEIVKEEPQGDEIIEMDMEGAIQETIEEDVDMHEERLDDEEIERLEENDENVEHLEELEEQEVYADEEEDVKSSYQLFGDEFIATEADDNAHMVPYPSDMIKDPSNSQFVYEVKVIDQKCIMCYICHHTFDRKKEKSEHLAKAHKNSTLACNLCSFKAKTIQSLDSHLMLHENPDLLQSLETKQKQTPFDMPRSIRKESPGSVKMSRSRLSSNKRDPHRCYICNMEFKFRIAKDEHLNTVHADFDLKCKLCKRKCRSILGMDEHLQIHENPDLLAHMCYICSRFFRRAYELNAHIKYDHRPKKKDFTCDQCGYQAFIKENLKKHIENVHLNVKKFVCDECPDKKFTTKVSLDQHKIARHGMETEIMCQNCLRYFPSMTYLRTHKIKHCLGTPTTPRVINKVDVNIYRLQIDEDTFKCKICGKIYSGERSRDKISIHYANMHKYVCEHCPARFKNKLLLDQHNEKAHF